MKMRQNYLWSIQRWSTSLLTERPNSAICPSSLPACISLKCSCSKLYQPSVDRFFCCLFDRTSFYVQYNRIEQFLWCFLKSFRCSSSLFLCEFWFQSSIPFLVLFSDSLQLNFYGESLISSSHWIRSLVNLWFGLLLRCWWRGCSYNCLTIFFSRERCFAFTQRRRRCLWFLSER